MRLAPESWTKSLRKIGFRRNSNRRRPQPRKRLFVEPLEDRRMLSGHGLHYEIIGGESADLFEVSTRAGEAGLPQALLTVADGANLDGQLQHEVEIGLVAGENVLERQDVKVTLAKDDFLAQFESERLATVGDQIPDHSLREIYQGFSTLIGPGTDTIMGFANHDIQLGTGEPPRVPIGLLASMSEAIAIGRLGPNANLRKASLYHELGVAIEYVLAEGDLRDGATGSRDILQLGAAVYLFRNSIELDTTAANIYTPFYSDQLLGALPDIGHHYYTIWSGLGVNSRPNVIADDAAATDRFGAIYEAGVLDLTNRLSVAIDMPALVEVSTAAAGSAGVASTSTVTILNTKNDGADTFVWGKTGEEENNFCNSTSLVVGNGNGSDDLESFLRFDRSQFELADVTSAELTLTTLFSTTTGEITHDIDVVPDTQWLEGDGTIGSGIDWNDKPDSAYTIQPDVMVPAAPGLPVTFDVTSAVRQAAVLGDLDFSGELTLDDIATFEQIIKDPMQYEIDFDTFALSSSEVAERGNADYDPSRTINGDDAPGYFAQHELLQSDFDLDADVDGDDFLIWQQGFGQTNQLHSAGDANFDSNVDGNDFLLWQGDFGQSVTVPPSVSFRIHQSTEIDGSVTVYHSLDASVAALRPKLTITQDPDLDLRVFDSDAQGLLRVAYNVRFGDFTSGVDVGIYRSLDGVNYLPGLPGDRLMTHTLSAADVSVGFHEVTFGADFLADNNDVDTDYYLIAVLDDALAFEELDEENNAAKFAGGWFTETDGTVHYQGTDTVDTLNVDPTTAPSDETIYVRVHDGDDVVTTDTDGDAALWIFGGRGDDTYKFSGGDDPSADTLSDLVDGGDDTIDFSLMTAGVTLFILGNTANIENVIGTALSDVVFGNALDNRLEGGGGGDLLAGGAGNDTYVYSGIDNPLLDTLSEGFNDGSDTIDFSMMNDPVMFSLKDENLSQIENIVGSDWDDELEGHHIIGNRLEGGKGDDILSGLGGDDTYVFAGTDTGVDIIVETGGSEDTIDFSGIDIGIGITADIAGNIAGNMDGTIVDQLNQSNDLIKISYDLVEGSIGIENVIGSPLDDHITGNDLDNEISGGAGDDELKGGVGNDTYFFSTGADAVFEAIGEGVDTLDFSLLDSRITVDLSLTDNDPSAKIIDQIDLSVVVDPDPTDPTKRELERVVGRPFNDTITGDSADNILIGGDEMDRLYGNTGNDTIQGGDGGDPMLSGGPGDDLIYGGNGMDIIVGGPGNDHLEGGNDNDFYKFISNSTLDLGDDTIQELSASGTGDHDQLDFSDFAGGTVGLAIDLSQETIVNHALLLLKYASPPPNRAVEDVKGTDQADTIIGNSFDNRFYGGDGNDDLRGGEGRDVLMGEAGDDFIYGQEDLDTFEISDAIVNDIFDLSPQFSLTGSSWSTNTNVGFNDQQLDVAIDDGSNAASAVWTFDDLGEDPNPSIEVFVTWEPQGTPALSAEFVIYDEGGSQIGTPSVNQTAPPIDVTTADGTVWQSLGTYHNLNGELTVELKNSDAAGDDLGKFLLADAVRIGPIEASMELDPPSDLMLSNRDLVWTKPDNFVEMEPDGYEIQRSKTGLGEWIPFLGVSDLAAETTEVDEEFLPGGTQYYQIRSKKGLEVSVWSNIHEELDEREELAVKLSASVSTDPSQITVEWRVSKESVNRGYVFDVYRKPSGFGTEWGDPIATDIPVTGHVNGVMFWTDNDETLDQAEVMEYRVVRQSGFFGDAVIAATIKHPVTAMEHRGTIILVVDSRVEAPLAYEIERLKTDLIGDGWSIEEVTATHYLTEFPNSDPVQADLDNDLGDRVTAVNDAIEGFYDLDPENVKSVLLIGDVPVPFSGNQAPDGHTGLTRSMPSDVYYGDVDSGLWEDEKNFDDLNSFHEADNPYVAEIPRDARFLSVHNIPGDGRFDDDFVPDDGDGQSVELTVGRIDFSRMNDFASDHSVVVLNETENEIELLRRYLNKDHAYRHGLFQVPDRATRVDRRQANSFPVPSEWEYYTAIVGHNNVDVVNWIETMGSPGTEALFASASGTGHDHFELNGLGPNRSRMATSDVANTSTLSVFNAISASWIVGLNKSNNFLRGLIANDGYSLTASWNLDAAANADLLFQHMGVGETVGFANLVSQIGFDGNAVTETWRGLMGDPSLRAQVVLPPSDVGVTVGTGQGTVDLIWDASDEATDPDPDEPFLGYRVYQATGFDQKFSLVSNGTITDTSLSGITGTVNHVYMVRAVKLESTPSGTYENASQGAFSQTLWTVERAINLGFVGPETFGSFVPDTADDLNVTDPISVEHGSVTAGTPAEIFESARYDPSQIVIDVTDLTGGADYYVRLYFADLDELNTSVFDVTIEGTLVLDNFDLEDSVELYSGIGTPRPFSGIAKTFFVTVSGELNIVLDIDLNMGPVGENPMISAIEVITI